MWPFGSTLWTTIWTHVTKVRATATVSPIESRARTTSTASSALSSTLSTQMADASAASAASLAGGVSKSAVAALPPGRECQLTAFAAMKFATPAKQLDFLRRLLAAARHADVDASDLLIVRATAALAGYDPAAAVTKADAGRLYFPPLTPHHTQAFTVLMSVAKRGDDENPNPTSQKPRYRADYGLSLIHI